MSQYRAIRGMVDILPDDTPLWQMLEPVSYTHLTLPTILLV